MGILAATSRTMPPEKHLAQGLIPLVRILRQHGINSSPHLALANIPVSTLSKPNSHITAAQELGFTEEVIRVLKKPELGLDIGSAFHLSAYGILGMSIMTCENLLAASKLLFKNILMTWTYMHWTVSQQKDLATMALEPLCNLGSAHQYMVDRGLIASYLIFKGALGKELPLLELHIMQSKPDYSQKYEELFGCPIVFSSDFNGFTFASSYLYDPFLMASKASNKIYGQECEKICRQLEAPVSFKELIRQQILMAEQNVNDLGVIAERLFVTPRTVQRRLANENTSYKQILQETRRDLAIEHLQTTKYTVDQISYKLGYSDASTFCHAFKRWTGKAPSHYRNTS